MGAFNDEIKKTVDEVLQDEETAAIIGKRVRECVEKAVEDAFRWGDLEKAIKKKIESTLVPYIEKYDMSEFIPKMDEVLTTLANTPGMLANKNILENFKQLMIDEPPKAIGIDDIFKRYKKFCTTDMDTAGREVIADGDEPYYEPLEVRWYVEDDDNPSWSSYKYASLVFDTQEDDQEDLNRRYKLRAWKKGAWEIIPETLHELDSLRYMKSFDIFMHTLARYGTTIDFGGKETDDDEVISENTPECTFE